jgi:hypothetical protein
MPASAILLAVRAELVEALAARESDFDKLSPNGKKADQWKRERRWIAA